MAAAGGAFERNPFDLFLSSLSTCCIDFLLCAEDPKKPAGNSDPGRLLSQMSKEELGKLMQNLKTSDSQGPKEHKFWDTQPVPKLGASCLFFFVCFTLSLTVIVRCAHRR